MLETVSLAAFMIGLFVCLLSGISLVYALMAGYLIFFGYGLVRGHGVAELLRMSGSGVRKVRNILITFGLIGMLTALWRAALWPWARAWNCTTGPAISRNTTIPLT